jgi:tetratricopeptide (TPR) repeat protein
VGRYVVLTLIGEGGMGAVYSAHDPELDRRVALKFLHARLESVPSMEWRARLMREAQAMARLSHPNVVAIHDVGVSSDEHVFIAMEFVEGASLKRWVTESRPWREVLHVFLQAGAGLAAAHRAGIIHRDFKPDNVLLGSDGRARVTDFGLARSAGEGDFEAAATLPATPALTPASSGSALDNPLTRSGQAMGTPGYMAPEQYDGGVLDARTDVFAFCASLWHALFGEPPFRGKTVGEVEAATKAGVARDTRDSRVPSWLRRVLVRGLSAQPNERFASMADLVDALENDPARHRGRWLAGAGVVIAACAIAAGWAAHQRGVREECAAGERIMRETWNAQTRDAIGAALRASGNPLGDDFAKRAQQVLDDWSAKWSSAYRDAEEATRVRGVESTTTMNLRIACLEKEREEMGALVERLQHADRAVAHRALTAAYQLPQPKTCWEPNAARAAALPEAPGPRARVLALRHEVSETAALRMMGGCDGVIPAANRGIAEARAIPHPQSEAELLLVRSTCERQQGDSDASVATREEAFAAALAAGDDSIAAFAAAKIAFELGGNLARPREAERWLKIGRGALAREGRDDRAEAELLTAEVQILSEEGYAERTLALHERAIELLEKVYGPAHPGVAAAMNNYAADLNSVGRYEEAIAELRRGVAIDEALFGAQDPMLHIDYNNIGVGYTFLGRYDEARAALEHSLILVKPLGDMSANAVVPLASMAVVENHVGNPDAALSYIERAMTIVDATGDNGARYLPCLFEERGMALLAKGDAPAAVEACRHAVKVQEAQEVISPDKDYPDDALTCLGEAELAMGSPADAIEPLERALTLKKREWKAALPLTEFALARALRSAGRTPDRARSLAERALSELRQLPGVEKEVQAIREWRK